MTDQIDLNSATVYNSPSDIANWPIVSEISRIAMTSGIGMRIDSPILASWPSFFPNPTWTGPIQFTVWLVIKMGGLWYTSGIIQMWKERQDDDPRSIPPILTDYNKNYCYDARWGMMYHYFPKVGDEIGFFLSNCDARGRTDVSGLRERTAVMKLVLPANDSGIFNNGSPIPVPIPPPTPQPNPSNPGYQDGQMVRWAEEAIKITNDLGMICVHSGRFMYDATVGPDGVNPMGYDASFFKHIAELKRDSGKG